jgi:2-desacetyl-2-hydroxyethyl bacteriochlorophyllide A dehydrogenase
MRAGALVVDEIDDPRPGPGQVLVRTLACGICGSDLHALKHGDRMVEMAADGAGASPDEPLTPMLMSLERDVVMGHEFTAEVVEVGENVGGKVGDIVVSMPVTFDLSGVHPIGYSNVYPGGYGELMVLSDMLTIDVPNGLDPRHAALTEPMAVGVHAVHRAGVTKASSAVVLGCGPVGLAVIAALRLEGVEAIVAADYSPARRALATTMGAAHVVDPRDESAIDAWRALAPGTPLVIFEAVGVPGMLDDAMRMAPRGAEILVVGVCMEPDTVRPMRGIVRELTIRFALAYDPMEFADTLRRIAEGELPVAPLITGEVDIDGVAGAFDALADPDAHAKILVVPS